MRHSAFSLAFLVTTLLPWLYAGPAEAQATRTWVSGVGDDANPCSRTAPCKTFAGAISKTATNGEINCIDPGGFGAVTITKSITIDCWHVGGSILASSTTGVIVNIAAGNPNDPHRSARIRGLSINGTGSFGALGTRTGIDGVRVLQAGSVFIEETTIQDFAEQGVEVAASATVQLTLDDVKIRNCNVSGVKLATAAGQVVALLHDVRVHGCPVGLDAANRTRVGVRNSTFTHDLTGIQTTGVDNIVNADDIKVTFAANALIANPGSTIRLADSLITQNSTGLNANGGAIISMQHNSVFGNTVDGAFTSTAGKL
jgi:hypothetical protein